MQLLTPPTDNLYKFKALSGLSLILISLYFGFQLLDSRQEKVDRYGVEIEILGAERAIQLEDSRLLLEDVSKIEADLDKKNLEPSRTTLDRLRAKQQEIREQSRKSDLKNAELKAKTSTFNNSTTRTIFLLLYALAACIAGVYLAQTGFQQWQEKVQNLLDEELKKRVQGNT